MHLISALMVYVIFVGNFDKRCLGVFQVEGQPERTHHGRGGGEGQVFERDGGFGLLPFFQ
jgi:hypothetical protein